MISKSHARCCADSGGPKRSAAARWYFRLRAGRWFRKLIRRSMIWHTQTRAIARRYASNATLTSCYLSCATALLFVFKQSENRYPPFGRAQAVARSTTLHQGGFARADGPVRNGNDPQWCQLDRDIGTKAVRTPLPSIVNDFQTLCMSRTHIPLVN